MYNPHSLPPGSTPLVQYPTLESSGQVTTFDWYTCVFTHGTRHSKPRPSSTSTRYVHRTPLTLPRPEHTQSNLDGLVLSRPSPPERVACRGLRPSGPSSTDVPTNEDFGEVPHPADRRGTQVCTGGETHPDTVVENIRVVSLT